MLHLLQLAPTQFKAYFELAGPGPKQHQVQHCLSAVFPPVVGFVSMCQGSCHVYRYRTQQHVATHLRHHHPAMWLALAWSAAPQHQTAATSTGRLTVALGRRCGTASAFPVARHCAVVSPPTAVCATAPCRCHTREYLQSAPNQRHLLVWYQLGVQHLHVKLGRAVVPLFS